MEDDRIEIVQVGVAPEECRGVNKKYFEDSQRIISQMKGFEKNNQVLPVVSDDAPIPLRASQFFKLQRKF